MRQTDLGLNLTSPRTCTRKRDFLAQMECVASWSALVALVAPYAPEGKKGRPPFAMETILRIYLHSSNGTRCWTQRCKKHCTTYPCSASSQLLAGTADYPTKALSFAYAICSKRTRWPIRSLALVNKLLTCKALLLKTGTVVDATIIAAPSSAKNKDEQRDPETHQSKKGNQWFFGRKALRVHIGVDAESDLVHTVHGTAGNVNDVVQANSLLHGQETDVFTDAGYQGADKRPDARLGVKWHIAMHPGKRRVLDKTNMANAMIDKAEKFKVSVRAKVEYPFRVTKRQFGRAMVHYRGLKKNTAQLVTLFALSNLWMVRNKLMGAGI